MLRIETTECRLKPFLSLSAYRRDVRSEKRLQLLPATIKIIRNA